MSKDARNEDLELSTEEREQFDRLVALLAKRGFGEDGPPIETTFAQIEQFGHQAGRMVARAIDTHLAGRHAEHFSGESSCPGCDATSPPEARSHALPLQSQDGEVILHEPTCHCPSCRRDFFPSEVSSSD